MENRGCLSGCAREGEPRSQIKQFISKLLLFLFHNKLCFMGWSPHQSQFSKHPPVISRAFRFYLNWSSAAGTGVVCCLFCISATLFTLGTQLHLPSEFMFKSLRSSWECYTQLFLITSFPCRELEAFCVETPMLWQQSRLH